LGKLCFPCFRKRHTFGLFSLRASEAFRSPNTYYFLLLDTTGLVWSSQHGHRCALLCLFPSFEFLISPLGQWLPLLWKNKDNFYVSFVSIYMFWDFYLGIFSLILFWRNKYCVRLILSLRLCQPIHIIFPESFLHDNILFGSWFSVFLFRLAVTCLTISSDSLSWFIGNRLFFDSLIVSVVSMIYVLYLSSVGFSRWIYEMTVKNRQLQISCILTARASVYSNVHCTPECCWNIYLMPVECSPWFQLHTVNR